ncbi:MAG: molecular chaperone TorD family protein [Gammaproteobacteria bacterium]|jgi:TorA maturation chaperone TorD|nr:molecular chaperone TorD family protein [Gammaproteobacteria bacterium]
MSKPVTEAPGVPVEREQELRANVYRLLAALLAAPPTEELFALLRDIDAQADQQQGPLVAAWRMLAVSARKARVDDVDDEFHALFIGAGRGELLPYGSWYLTGFLMEKPLAELRQDLLELGYARQEEVREPEDHAAALCEVMSMLVSDPDIGAAREKRFFENHIGPWMGRFFEDLEGAESAGFYSAVGLLGKEFLGVEQQYLAMTPH